MAPNFSLRDIVRPNILALKPYRCARDDYDSGILLDANENSLGPAVNASQAAAAHAQALHRYPDPLHRSVKERIAKLRQLPSTDHIFLGVGSDEVIDLLVRIFCVPAKDKILITPPTYGMYNVTAQINDVAVVKVPLLVDQAIPARMFQLDVPNVLRAVEADPTIKMVFVCSPGNPTGTLIDPQDVQTLLDHPGYRGLVVVDEAYVDFVETHKGGSLAQWVERYPNLVVMQTMSKSFGLAGIRLGLAIAHPDVITLLNNTKAPYNVSTLTATVAMAALDDEGIAVMQGAAAKLRDQRARLIRELPKIRGVGQIIGGNDANFVLCQILTRPDGGRSDGQPDQARALRVYERMAQECGLVVRFRGTEYGCDGCLRITVGSPEENDELLKQLAANLEIL